jgi:hypothetical protein
VHHVKRDAALGEGVHQFDHALHERVGEHVVAHPVLEQIAEDEHGVGLIRGDADEMLEGGDRARNRVAQMQIRDEQKRACRVWAFALAGHARSGVS